MKSIVRSDWSAFVGERSCRATLVSFQAFVVVDLATHAERPWHRDLVRLAVRIQSHRGPRRMMAIRSLAASAGRFEDKDVGAKLQEHAAALGKAAGALEKAEADRR